MPGLMSGLYLGGNDLPGSNGKDKSPNHREDSVFTDVEESDADDDTLYENPQTVRGSRKRAHSPSDGGRKKQAKVRGGRPAVNKPVTEDLDSDDQRIFELKSQNYTEAAIIEKLKDEGRTTYKPGAVSSRYARIRKMFEKIEDERLDDELSDWHVGEDELLNDSVNKMQQWYDNEVRKLEAKKWENVSRILNPQLPLADGAKKYTSKACRERWSAVQAGNALDPIELASDQEERKRLREDRIAENKRLRAEAKATIQRQRDAERRAKEEKLRAKSDKQNEKVEAKLARDAERAELQRISAERKAGKLRKMQERKEAREAWKAEIDEKRRIRELEERIYRSITGKALNRVRRMPGHDDSIVDDTQGLTDDEQGDDADDENAGGHEPPNRTPDSNDRSDGYDDMSDLHSDREEDQYPDGKDDDEADEEEGNSEAAVAPPTPTATPPAPTEPVSAATLNNPRIIMTIFELDDLLRERKLDRAGAKESHAQVVARLDAADYLLKATELKALLQSRFAKVTGDKKALITRLQEHDATRSAAGRALEAEAEEAPEDVKPAVVQHAATPGDEGDET